MLCGAQVDQTGDVIEFYNAVFIPSTKAFLLQLGNGTASLLPLPTLTMPGTPLHGRLGSNPYGLATPPPPDRTTINKCLSPAGKVFVSPMRQPGQQVSHSPGVSHHVHPITWHSMHARSEQMLSQMVDAGAAFTCGVPGGASCCIGTGPGSKDWIGTSHQHEATTQA